MHRSIRVHVAVGSTSLAAKSSRTHTGVRSPTDAPVAPAAPLPQRHPTKIAVHGRKVQYNDAPAFVTALTLVTSEP